MNADKHRCDWGVGLRAAGIAALLATLSAAVGCAGPKKLTEREEYFAGRAISANVLSETPVYEKDPALTEYVNLLGLNLALVTRRPQPFQDYTFVVLDSDVVNAFAAPGGFIFVTRGAIAAAQNEDELAGILAHEIAHVVSRHPEDVLQKQIRVENRMKIVSGILAIGAAGAAADGDAQSAAELAEAAKAFDDTIGSVIKDVVTNGYSRDKELQADESGVRIATTLGYDPAAMLHYLERLDYKGKDGPAGWAGNTHPSPKDRVKAIRTAIEKGNLRGAIDPTRTERFARFTASIRQK